MILGRTSELKYLNNYYNRQGSQILIVYGQKNIGKTALVKEFVEDKPSHYFMARACSEREMQYQWGKQFSLSDNEIQEFPSFTEILQRAVSNKPGKKVIVIDEFQNIVKTSEHFMGELVSFVHSHWNENDVMVVLCSSSIGWVENSMVTRIGEAAYELSGFLKIREMSFHDVILKFPNFRIEECVEAYAVLGGIPGLWNQFDDKLTIQQNICRNILNNNSFLYAEGERLVKEQLREPGVYNTILASMAAGHNKLNDLYLHTGFSRAKISVYLKSLIELELVEKVFSYDTEGRDNVQKGVYQISHPFVDFYFTYLYPNLSMLETISVGEFYNTYIAPNFKDYVSKYFKKICRQNMEGLNDRGKLPITIETVGEWVGKIGTLDIIAQDEEQNTIIGVCNWERPMMTYDDYENMLLLAKKARIKADYIYMYTASRFDEKLNLEAKVKTNLKLLQISDL